MVVDLAIFAAGAADVTCNVDTGHYVDGMSNCHGVYFRPFRWILPHWLKLFRAGLLPRLGMSGKTSIVADAVLINVLQHAFNRNSPFSPKSRNAVAVGSLLLLPLPCWQLGKLCDPLLSPRLEW